MHLKKKRKSTQETGCKVVFTPCDPNLPRKHTTSKIKGAANVTKAYTFYSWWSSSLLQARTHCNFPPPFPPLSKLMLRSQWQLHKIGGKSDDTSSNGVIAALPIRWYCSGNSHDVLKHTEIGEVVAKKVLGLPDDHGGKDLRAIGAALLLILSDSIIIQYHMHCFSASLARHQQLLTGLVPHMRTLHFSGRRWTTDADRWDW